MAKTNSLKIAPYAKRVIRDFNGTRDSTGGYPIVFDGMHLLEYTYGRPGEQETIGWSASSNAIEWRDNDPFEATLKIVRLERGRSAARFWFRDETNLIEYPFFGQTLVDMLSQSTMVNGVVTGTWIVVKKGANYGIEMYQ